jgi:hypothetical protein
LVLVDGNNSCPGVGIEPVFLKSIHKSLCICCRAGQPGHLGASMRRPVFWPPCF